MDTPLLWVKSAFSWIGKVMYAFVPVLSRNGWEWSFMSVGFRRKEIPESVIQAMNGSHQKDRNLKFHMAKYGLDGKINSEG